MSTTIRSIVNSLPVELDSLIAQCLSDDLAALRAFALTSQSWLAAGRPILFSKLSLRTEAEYARLLDTFQSSPELASYVKRLRISHKVTLTERFTSRLSSVQEVEFFASYGMFGEWNASHHSALARLQTIKKLCFHHYQILPVHIAQVVCLFPVLEQLEVVSCFTPYVGAYAAKNCVPASFPPRPAGLRLNNLRILHANDAVRPLLDWLHGLETLRCVNLQFTPSANPYIPGFLRSLGSALEVLELSCEDYIFKWSEDQCSDCPSKIDLSANPSLHTLQFSHIYGLELYYILKNIPSGQIDTITFHLSPRFRWHKIDHPRFVSALSSPNFASLRKLRFIHDEPLSTNLNGALPVKRADHVYTIFDTPGGARKHGFDVEQLKGKDGQNQDPYVQIQRHCHVQHITAEDWLPAVKWSWAQDAQGGADE